MKCQVECKNCGRTLYWGIVSNFPRRSIIAYTLTSKGRVQVDRYWYCNLTCYELHSRLPPEF